MTGFPGPGLWGFSTPHSFFCDFYEASYSENMKLVWLSQTMTLDSWPDDWQLRTVCQCQCQCMCGGWRNELYIVNEMYIVMEIYTLACVVVSVILWVFCIHTVCVLYTSCTSYVALPPPPHNHILYHPLMRCPVHRPWPAHGWCLFLVMLSSSGAHQLRLVRFTW